MTLGFHSTCPALGCTSDETGVRPAICDSCVPSSHPAAKLRIANRRPDPHQMTVSVLAKNFARH